MKYRKKPVVIEAIQWDETMPTLQKLRSIGMSVASYSHRMSEVWSLRITTLEGTMNVSKGDWIIKGVKGEFYPCKPDVFEATYEPVTANSGETL